MHALFLAFLMAGAGIFLHTPANAQSTAKEIYERAAERFSAALPGQLRFRNHFGNECSVSTEQQLVRGSSGYRTKVVVTGHGVCRGRSFPVAETIEVDRIAGAVIRDDGTGTNRCFFICRDFETCITNRQIGIPSMGYRTTAVCRVLEDMFSQLERIGIVRDEEVSRVGMFKFNCRHNPGTFGNPLGKQTVAIEAKAVMREWRKLAESGSLDRLFRKLRPFAKATCRAQMEARRQVVEIQDLLDVTIMGDSSVIVRARYENGSWRVFRNEAPARVAREARRQAAIEEQKRKAREREEKMAREKKDRREKRKAFISSYRVETWENLQKLQSNPFPYKNKIVGTYAQFVQMLSENEAFFGQLVLSGVPSAMFVTPGQNAILAVRVRGLKTMKLPMGMERPVPYGEYVGAYICTQSRCADFFDP